MAGGYDKKVYHIDPRAGVIHETKAYHKKPVLALAVDDNYIITGSEDSTVKVFDRRKAAISATITVSFTIWIYSLGVLICENMSFLR